MDLPGAASPIAPWIPPLVAFAISLLTSAAGVSGAFLLLPFQMSVLGFTSPAVSATNQLYNVVAIPSGVLRYVREGRMLWPLALAVVAGTLPGVVAGALVRVRYLPDPARFKLFAAAVLLWLGIRLVIDLVRGRGAAAGARLAGAGPLPRVTDVRSSWSRVRYTFAGEQHGFATSSVFALALAVGLVGGVYGIGGGAIMAPFFVAVLGLPIHTVAGAALLGTLVTSVAGVGCYQALAPLYPGIAVAPDWRLGLLFGVGGAAGTYLGARLQKHLPGRAISCVLALLVLALAGRYAVEAMRAFF